VTERNHRNEDRSFEDKLPVNGCPVSFAFITGSFYHVVAHLIHMYEISGSRVTSRVSHHTQSSHASPDSPYRS